MGGDIVNTKRNFRRRILIFVMEKIMNLTLHSNKIDDYLKHDDVIGYLSK